MSNGTSGKKTVLITGTSSGVGLASAISFAASGYNTVATMRDISKRDGLEQAAAKAGVSLDIRSLDVEHPEAGQTCIKQIVDIYGRLDVLVNNAGAGYLGSIEQTSDADLRRIMEVNFFGVWNLTKAAIPIMRQQGSGRIITVTSVGGLLGQPFNEAYCAAKFAVEGMMEGFAPLARRMGIHVSLIEPGPINTEFVSNVRATSGPTLVALVPPYDRFLSHYMAASGNVFSQYGQTGAEIAAFILQAAQADQPHLRYVTSEFARKTVSPKVTDFDGDAVVEAFAARLGN